MKIVGKLKDFFRPRSALGLKVDSRSMAAVRVSSGLGSIEIEDIIFREIKNPEDPHGEWAEFLKDLHPPAEIVISVLPMAPVMIREIALGFESHKKLEKIIRYQMEPYIPVPVENVIVDFLPPDKKRPILCFCIEKDIIAAHLEDLSKAGMEPDVVSLEAVALLNLFNHNYLGGPGYPVFLIHVDEEKMLLLVIHENRPDFIRVLHGMKFDPDRITESLNLYRLKNPHSEPGEVLLTGPLALTDIKDRLQEILNIKTTLWRPFDGVKTPTGEIEPDMQDRLAIPLGLAVGALKGSSKTFNLRKEELAPGKSSNLKHLIVFMLTGLFLFMALFSINLYQKLHIKERYYSELRTGITQTLMDAFPQSAQIIKGREQAQMKQKISDETGKYQWLVEFTKNRAVLDVLLALTRIIALYSDVVIENISIEGPEVHLDGQASSFNTVDKLRDNLSKTPDFKDVKLVGAKTDGKDNLVKFGFVLKR
ncbi:PilN domain-containing protein [Thermodesulfobacteriota bacterium]